MATLAPDIHREIYTRRGDDPDHPPAPGSCLMCGADIPWGWLRPRGALPGRFSRPPRTCKGCRRLEEVAAAREALAAAQKLSGVPARFRAYHWGRNLKQGHEEDAKAFVKRVEQADERTIGITWKNRNAALAFRDWRPNTGDSLFLHGHTGAGKTLFAACLVRELLRVPLGFRTPEYRELPARYRAWVDQGRRPPLVRTGGWSVFFVQEGDLQRSQYAWYSRSRYDNQAVEPMGRAREAQVLVIDDLGTAGGGEKWARQMEGLIDHRYTHELPTIMTSNVPLEAIGEHYESARLQSRLYEIVGQRHWNLEMPVDWREALGQIPLV